MLTNSHSTNKITQLRTGWANKHLLQVHRTKKLYTKKKQKLGKNFSRMFVLAKKIKKLFAFTLNGITASVRRVSSMIVGLNA